MASLEITRHPGAPATAIGIPLFATLLIPFLAIAFSVLKGLGAQSALEPLLRQVAGDSGETVTRIISYVNNTNFKSIGAIGLLALVMTAISLLGNIEEAFNVVSATS